MIDREILRAVMLTFLVVMTAKFSSAVYDHWMSDTQDLMIENQAALSLHQQGLAAQQNEAAMKVARTERCEQTLRDKTCALPKDFKELGECLFRLGSRDCDQLPSVQLCAAVEELKLCSDPFEDQKKNGCDRLRRQAACKAKPAPADRQGLWRVRFDDGIWLDD